MVAQHIKFYTVKRWCGKCHERVRWHEGMSIYHTCGKKLRSIPRNKENKEKYTGGMKRY